MPMVHRKLRGRVLMKLVGSQTFKGNLIDLSNQSMYFMNQLLVYS